MVNLQLCILKQTNTQDIFCFSSLPDEAYLRFGGQRAGAFGFKPMFHQKLCQFSELLDVVPYVPAMSQGLFEANKNKLQVRTLGITETMACFLAIP